MFMFYDEGTFIWTIIAFVLSIVGCFLVYFLFLKKDVKTDNKILPWLKEFLSFDKMLIEPILKILYIFTALFITLGSFGLISASFLSFLITLIVGNILARIAYESMLIIVMLWKNTNEIKNKLKK